MPKDNICINKEYVENQNNYSAISLQWITYLEKLNNKVIQSAFRGRESEIKIINVDNKEELIKVDGYDSKNNIAYQFHGCYWHGCQKCYKPDDLNKEKNKLMIDLYNKTLETS